MSSSKLCIAPSQLHTVLSASMHNLNLRLVCQMQLRLDQSFQSHRGVPFPTSQAVAFPASMHKTESNIFFQKDATAKGSSMMVVPQGAMRVVFPAIVSR